MAGTSAGAAKRQRCEDCNGFAHSGPCGWRRGPQPKTISERVEQRAIPVGDCRVWEVPGGGRPMTQLNGKKGLVTRLLWEEANGPIPEGMVLRHSCDNPQCVLLAHLSLGTQGDNVNDAVSRDRISKGADRWNSTLTPDDIRSIRTDTRSHSQIAATYGIQRRQVGRIKDRTRWGWVPDDGPLRIRDVVNILDH